MTGCTVLTKGIQAGCAATKKVGGLDKRIYIGSIFDLTAVTFGTGNEITGFTFAEDKGLVKYIGRRDKNNTASEIEVGENVNLRNQTVNISVYWETAVDLATLDALIDHEGVFAIVESVAGQLEVFGINKVNFDSFGLRVSANAGSSGTLLNDPTAFALALSGGHTNLQLLYNSAIALATNIAALDAQTIDPAPVEPPEEE